MYKSTYVFFCPYSSSWLTHHKHLQLIIFRNPTRKDSSIDVAEVEEVVNRPEEGEFNGLTSTCPDQSVGVPVRYIPMGIIDVPRVIPLLSPVTRTSLLLVFGLQPSNLPLVSSRL
jgi:hypothetical protein